MSGPTLERLRKGIAAYVHYVLCIISCLLTKWRRVRPEPVLRAYDARLADQSVPVVAAECDQSANGQAPLAEAGAPDASIKRRNRHHALNDCGDASRGK